MCSGVAIIYSCENIVSLANVVISYEKEKQCRCWLVTDKSLLCPGYRQSWWFIGYKILVYYPVEIKTLGDSFHLL